MEIRAQWNDFGNALEILICEERNGRLYAAKPISLELEEIPELGAVKPTMTFFRESGQVFLKAMATLLRDLNIKPPNESKIEGLLEGTKYHLEDLRKLLFEYEVAVPEERIIIKEKKDQCKTKE